MSDKDKKDKTPESVEDTPEEKTETTETTPPAADPPKKKPRRRKAAAKKEEPAADTASAEWKKVVDAFAKTLGMEYATVSAALTQLCGGNGDDEADLLGNAKYTPDADIIAAIGADAVPRPKMLKALDELRFDEEESATAPAPGAAGVQPATPAGGLAQMLGVGNAAAYQLPTPPGGDPILASVRAGGISKVGDEEVIIALRVALAARVGYFDITKRISERFDKLDDEMEEPAGDKAYDVAAAVAREDNADIIKLLKEEMGMPDPGKFVTKAYQRKLLDRVPEAFNSILTFHQILGQWHDTWKSDSPFGLVDPTTAPPMDTVRAASEAVNEAFNKVFRGRVKPAAYALSHRAQQIKELLNDPEMPRLLLAGNREQMLKVLGVSVGLQMDMLERNLVQYVHAIRQIHLQGDGSLPFYLRSLYQTGQGIPWSELGMRSGSSTSVQTPDGTRDRRRDHDRFGSK